MEVILLEKIGRLGTMGDVVRVRDGFARNFLIPQHKALRATEDNKKTFESRRKEIEKQNEIRRQEALKAGKGLDKLSLVLVRQASEDGKLYGSVSVRDIELELKEKGYDVPRKLIHLTSTIKNTGSYAATLSLHAEVEYKIEVRVVRNESEIEEAPKDLTLEAIDPEAAKAEAGAEVSEEIDAADEAAKEE